MPKDKDQVLVVADSPDSFEKLVGSVSGSVELVRYSSKADFIDGLDSERYVGVFLADVNADDFLYLRRFLRENTVLDYLPIGVATIDKNKAVIRANKQFCEWFDVPVQEVRGRLFYDLLHRPEIIDGDPSPLYHCVEHRQPVECKIRFKHSHRVFQMNVSPVFRSDENGKGEIHRYIIVLRDVSRLEEYQKKLNSIQNAGKDLANISVNDVLSMSTDAQIEMLKQKILLYTKDILHYDKIEIRLISHEEPGLLAPLLAVGFDREAMERKLYARPEENGVTGYVAFHAKPYLVEDAELDPIFVPGVTGARSSMTVPLLIRGHVIGTFNVESLEPRAFSETDLHYLESFAQDVAQALNTMNLFTIEQSEAYVRSFKTIHAEIAVPINTIVTEALGVLARHGELDHDAADRIRTILTTARDIQVLIQTVGNRMLPSKGHPVVPAERYPVLKGKHILVVDGDESVGLAISTLLFWNDCTVEMVPNVDQALLLAKNTSFDLFISDIHPDGKRSGMDLFTELKQMLGKPYVPLILMKGYGYDPGHVTVNAKQAGVTGFLAKPFTLDLLVPVVESVLEEARERNGPANDAADDLASDKIRES